MHTQILPVFTMTGDIKYPFLKLREITVGRKHLLFLVQMHRHREPVGTRLWNMPLFLPLFIFWFMVQSSPYNHCCFYFHFPFPFSFFFPCFFLFPFPFSFPFFFLFLVYFCVCVCVCFSFSNQNFLFSSFFSLFLSHPLNLSCSDSKVSRE